MIFPLLGGNGGISKYLKFYKVLDYLFKAEMVRFRDISHFWSDFSLFQSKTNFWRKFSFWAPFSCILAPKPVFAPLDLQKPPQKLTFITTFARGAPGPHFGPKSAFWGAKITKRTALHPKTHFWPPGPPWGLDTLKNTKYFIRNT